MLRLGLPIGFRLFMPTARGGPGDGLAKRSTKSRDLVLNLGKEGTEQEWKDLIQILNISLSLALECFRNKCKIL